MKDDYAQTPFDMAEFAENAEPRCACVLLLDVSGSMAGEPIAELNRGLELFAPALREDRLAARRVDVAVVTFGGTVNVVAQFGSAQDFYPQPLTATGGTPMGEAINVGLDLLAVRQAEYRANGITPYRPVAFMVTDGKPTDTWKHAAQRVQAGEACKSFSFFSVGVSGADTNTLAQISTSAPVMLRGLDFTGMFRWLSASLTAVSRSSVGQTVAVANPTAPAGWATIA